MGYEWELTAPDTGPFHYKTWRGVIRRVQSVLSLGLAARVQEIGGWADFEVRRDQESGDVIVSGFYTDEQKRSVLDLIGEEA